ncbi:MAG: hypothetical protein MRK01_11170 [Candidatus Scalindua sp.]|nr:hypothetical protein [Candidatus Scalindua sp.]
MTTQLKGEKTFFLPFNRGSSPGEIKCGAGNPSHLSGYCDNGKIKFRLDKVALYLRAQERITCCFGSTAEFPFKHRLTFSA